MAFQVSRSDTGQFVLIDPTTDTVVIDDDLAAGFDKLERATADAPAKPAGAGPTLDRPAAAGSSTFTFAGGPRYTPILLAVVLPFAWLAVFYVALAHLLSEHALERAAARQMQEQIDALELEIQAVRSELSGAPRSAKTKPKRSPKPDPAAKQKPLAAKLRAAGTGTGDAEPDGGATRE